MDAELKRWLYSDSPIMRQLRMQRATADVKPGVLDKALGGLGSLGYALDTPGAYTRGALAGKLGERASGRDVIQNLGGGAAPEGFDWKGLGVEVAADPFNLLGVGLLTKAGKAGKAAQGASAALKAAKTAGNTKRIAEATEALAKYEKIAAAGGPKRALLSLDVPFTKSLRGIPLIEGKPVLKAAGAIGRGAKAIPGVRAAGKAMQGIFSTGAHTGNAEKDALLNALHVEGDILKEGANLGAARKSVAVNRLVNKFSAKHGLSPEEVRRMLNTAAEAEPMLAKTGGKVSEIGRLADDDIKPGMKVRALDRENLGTIVKFEPEAKSATVHFLNRELGTEATVELPTELLRQPSKSALTQDMMDEIAARMESMPQEIRASGGKILKGNAKQRMVEQARGVPTPDLADPSGMGYMPRVATEAGKKWARTLKSDHLLYKFGRPEHTAVGAFQKTRGGLFEGMPIEYANRYVHETLGGPAEFFIEDPAKSLAIRGIKGAQKRADALILQGVAEHLGGSADEVVNGMKTSEFLQRAGISTAGKLTKNLGEFVPVDAAEEVLRIREVLRDPKELEGFGKFYDQLNNTMRASVTMLFPAFHGRNAMSNVFLNWIGGVTDPRWYVQAAHLQLKGAAANPAMFRELQVHGILAGGQIGAEITGMVAGRGALPRVQKATWLGRQAGKMVENNARVAHYLAKRASGMTAVEAAASVKKHLFDYGDLTQIERRYFRRHVYFYTFMRKNLPLQLETLMTQPRKQILLSRLSGAHEGERTELPIWQRNKAPIRLGKETFASLGLPHEDLGNFATEEKGLGRSLQKAAGMLAPIPRLAIEQIGGREMYTGRAIGGAAHAPEAWGKMPGWFKKLVNYNERRTSTGRIQRTADTRVVNVLRNLPTSRLTSTIEYFLRSDKPTFDKWLKVLTGIRLDRVDLPDAKRREYRRLYDLLMDRAGKRGDVATWEKKYGVTPEGRKLARIGG